MARTKVRWLAMSLLVSGVLGLGTSTAIAWTISVAYAWSGRSWTYMVGVEWPSAASAGTTELLHYGVADQVRTGLRRTTFTPSASRWPLTAQIIDAVKAGCLPQVSEMLQSSAAMPELARAGWEPWIAFPHSAPSELLALTHRAVGWPTLCFHSQSWTDMHGRTTDRGSLRVVPAPLKQPGSADPLLGTIPLLPLWPGLLTNTAALAAPWWLLLFGIGAWRVRRRSRRGHCPTCNYDLVGDLSKGCPECGWNRTNNPPS